MNSISRMPPRPSLTLRSNSPGLDDLVLDAIFDCGHFAQDALVDRTRVAERLDHLQKFSAQGRVSRDGAGLDQHHPFPGLAPLGIIVLVALQERLSGPASPSGRNRRSMR